MTGIVVIADCIEINLWDESPDGTPPAGDEGEAEANVSSRCRHGDASAERTIGRAEVGEGASGGRFPKGTRRANWSQVE